MEGVKEDDWLKSKSVSKYGCVHVCKKKGVILQRRRGRANGFNRSSVWCHIILNADQQIPRHVVI